nr:hypothetical protein [Candidatus Njordarchaeota archaeon]
MSWTCSLMHGTKFLACPPVREMASEKAPKCFSTFQINAIPPIEKEELLLVMKENSD